MKGRKAGAKIKFEKGDVFVLPVSLAQRRGEKEWENEGGE